MKQLIEFTQDEKIELLKQGLTQIISETDLPISIIYYVFNEYLMQLKGLYSEYSNTLLKSIIEKMNKNEDISSFNEIEAELKKDNPNFQITKKEKR